MPDNPYMIGDRRLSDIIQDIADEWKELVELGVVVQYDNGLNGMANGPEFCLIPLCNDQEDQ